jgi:uncharacterized protein (TIGR02145 family)
MKEAGFSNWVTPNTGATNFSGFNGLPGGYRAVQGNFIGQGTSAEWWTATKTSNSMPYNRNVSYNNSTILRGTGWPKFIGFSVRCVRD